jgi:hypothetical protein
MLDFDVVADISRLQKVRNRKVLSTSCVIAIRSTQRRQNYLLYYLVCYDMLDFDVVADICRLQFVRNRKVLSTSCVIAIRWPQRCKNYFINTNLVCA